MKILIAGKDSYIGTHIRDFLTSYNHQISELDTLNDSWKTFDYSSFDAIVHVAAIVHESAKIASEELFKKVNTDLPYNIAVLAKNVGVKNFVFLSTMAVYGCDKKLPKGNVINEKTELKPTTLYGKSKLEAEKMLSTLADDSFKVAFVRPPNVYGRDCPGNYMNIFKKIALKLPVFPYAYNDDRQSMLYIDNLSNLVRLIIENSAGGIFHPQDDFIPSTNDLVKAISSALNKKSRTSKFLGFFVKIFSFLGVVKKLYGGVSYEHTLSDSFDNVYRIVSFKEGINRTFCD